MKVRTFFTALFLAFSVKAAPVTALVYSPDGSALFSAAHRAIQIRSPETGAVLQTIVCDFPRVTGLAITPNGTLVAGGGEPGVSGTVMLFTNGVPARRFTGFDDLVTCVAVNGESLAMASADGSAKIQDLDSTKDPIRLTGHSGPVLAVAFSPDGTLVATGGADRSIKIWSRDGALLRSLNHHTEAVHTLATRVNESGRFECASGSDDQTVRIWQPSIGRMVRIIRGHLGPVFALTYSPDQRALFSAGKEGILRKLDVESDAVLWAKRISREVIYSIAVHPSGRSLAAGDWAGNVTVVGLE